MLLPRDEGSGLVEITVVGEWGATKGRSDLKAGGTDGHERMLVLQSR